MATERDPAIELWPIDTIKAETVVPGIDKPLIEGPQPISNRPQSVSSSAGTWKVTYQGVKIRQNNILAARALLLRLQTTPIPIYVTPYAYPYGPDRRSNVPGTILSTFSDGTIFTDGTRFTTTIFNCTLGAAAAEEAVSLTINNSPTAPVLVGDYIELAGRMYMLTSKSGNKYTIWPPLREGVAAGMKVEIADPRFVAFLTPSPENSVALLYGRWGDVNLEFKEAAW